MMDAASTKTSPAQAGESTAKRARKSRQPIEEMVRYFLAKEGTNPVKPELGEEVPNEGEALIKAFQSKAGIVYVLHTYKAEAEMQSGTPTLVKRPLQR